MLPTHSPLLSRVPHSQRERSVPLYHYTTADRLCGILTQRAIQPAPLGVIPPEIPAVWLSTAPLWEASATKGVIRQGRRRTASLAERLETSGCLVRIHIDPAALEIIPAAASPPACAPFTNTASATTLSAPPTSVISMANRSSPTPA